MEKTGAEILLQALSKEGVDVIFGYPGANSLPIHDSLEESPIRHYLVRHEQAAAHAADGYARATGKVGVCMGTSGPGATNLVTGIATAYMDSTPMVVLTGQVTTELLGSDAFQETDIIGITMPITKHSYIVSDPGEVKATVKQAFEIARSGRPGPVLIDLPRNVMAAKCEQSGVKNITMPEKRHAKRKKDGEELQRIANYMNMSERPVILVGGGVKLARACDELTGLIEKGNLPFVSTMMGIGSVRSSNGFNLGFIGTHGNELANRIVHDSDFILTVGARFSDRSTSIVEEFAPPIFVLFFVSVGAQLDLGGMARWMWILAFVYVIARTAGKFIGANIGSKLGRAAPSVRKYLGLCLFSQAGVAVGLSISASHRFSGDLGTAIIMIIALTTFIAQIIGPSSVKYAVKKAGEVGMRITEEDLIESYRVADMVNKTAKVFLPDTPLETVLGEIAETDELAYPVVDDSGKLLGIVTLNELRRSFMSRELNKFLVVYDMMEPPSASVTEETPLAEAVSLMKKLEVAFLERTL